jgi:hypothetical protein
LYRDLLLQARELATHDPRKPRQVNLRRSVSSAYYALFHALVDETCRLMLGARHQEAPYRYVLGRAFMHGTMKQACMAFAGGSLKATVAKGLPASCVIPVEIRAVADAFVNLQQWRHLADYDRSDRFLRSDALALVGQAEKAVNALIGLASSSERNFFLSCLLTWNTLAGR